MGRLFKSYKFYGALFGTASAFLGSKVFELDTTILAIVVGLWATVIAGQAWKDAALLRTTNPEIKPPPPPDDD